MKRKVCTPVDMLHHVKVTWNVWDHLLLHIIHEVHILHTPAGWKFLLINNFIYTCSHTKTFSCLFLFCYRVRKHLLHHVWPIVMLYWHDHFIIVQIHNVLISAMTVTFITIILVFCSSTSLVHISEEAIIDWDVLVHPLLPVRVLPIDEVMLQAGVVGLGARQRGGLHLHHTQGAVVLQHLPTAVTTGHSTGVAREGRAPWPRWGVSGRCRGRWCRPPGSAAPPPTPPAASCCHCADSDPWSTPLSSSLCHQGSWGRGAHYQGWWPGPTSGCRPPWGCWRGGSCPRHDCYTPPTPPETPRREPVYNTLN